MSGQGRQGSGGRGGYVGNPPRRGGRASPFRPGGGSGPRGRGLAAYAETPNSREAGPPSPGGGRGSGEGHPVPFVYRQGGPPRRPSPGSPSGRSGSGASGERERGLRAGRPRRTPPVDVPVFSGGAGAALAAAAAATASAAAAASATAPVNYNPSEDLNPRYISDASSRASPPRAAAGFVLDSSNATAEGFQPEAAAVTQSTGTSPAGYTAPSQAKQLENMSQTTAGLRGSKEDTSNVSDANSAPIQSTAVQISAPVLAKTSMEIAYENSRSITDSTESKNPNATSAGIVYGDFPVAREAASQNFVRGSIRNVTASVDNLAGKVLGEERKKRIGGSIALLFTPVSLRPVNEVDNTNRPRAAPTATALSIKLPPSMNNPPRRQQKSAIGKRHIVFSVSLARVKGKKPLVIVGICILCTYVLLVEIIFNGGFEDPAKNISIGPSAVTLLRLGARFGNLIEKGDWYRLVAPIFLHAGILHLLMNLLALKNIGIPAEQEFGHGKILFIFLLSGIFGVLMSNLFAPNVVGVGASGGIFGLFGACWADITLNFRLYRGHAKKVITQLGFSTLGNFAVGLVPFVDNFAHMGGMIAGFLIGLSLLVHKRYTRKGDLKPLYQHQRILRWVSLIVFPIVFVSFSVLVFTGENLQDSCPSCVFFTCVPLPIWDCGFVPSA